MNKIVKVYNIYLLLIIAITLLIAGCRSVKTISEKEKPTPMDPNLGVISILEKKIHRFYTMKARKVEFDLNMNGVGEKVKGNIALYRDSLIAVSVIPALGYELLRILCTEDSVIIINRPERSYSASSFDFFKKKYNIPVGFGDLQAILVNEVFYYKENYEDRIFKKQLNTSDQKNLFIVNAFKGGKRITNQRIEIDNEGRKLENVHIIDHEIKIRLNLDYQSFVGVGGVVFPTEITIDIVENNNNIKMDLRYGQVIFDDSLNIKFSVPDSYTRTDI